MCEVPRTRWQWRRYGSCAARQVNWPCWKIHCPGSTLPIALGEASEAGKRAVNRNKNDTISDRFICFILTVKRRWRPVFWGRQLKKVVNFFEEISASGWPGWRIYWPRNDLAPLLRWRCHWLYLWTTYPWLMRFWSSYTLGMGAGRHGQEGALATLWKCCKVFLCISRYSKTLSRRIIRALFSQPVIGFWGLRPRPPLGPHRPPPCWGTFFRRPLICPPLEKILQAPMTLGVEQVAEDARVRWGFWCLVTVALWMCLYFSLHFYAALALVAGP